MYENPFALSGAEVRENVSIGIGIDTGGTYTDAVAYDVEQGEVLAWGKARTTKEDLSKGIRAALMTLPEDLRRQASVIALSTTLATNACVEDKGGRAKLVLMGTPEKVLHRIHADRRYGLDYDRVLCLETGNSFDGTVVNQPDWDAVIEDNEDWFSDAQAFAICEANAARNGAVCELSGKEALRRFDVPIVMGCELSSKLNMMARGATALLNARLLPVVETFMHATREALYSCGVRDVLVMIVRSDGSLMSVPYALDRPVETILSGPAASVEGSRALCSIEDGVIVDMGGTTTDISLVKEAAPVMTEDIRIGRWQTQASGVFIKTVGLGGDSRVMAKDGVVALSPQRVEPLSAACARWPEFGNKVLEICGMAQRPQAMLFEGLYLVREPSNRADYTEGELELVDALKNGPVVIGDRERIDCYTLDSSRLEREGLVMRIGLTPTDAMVVRGDFDAYEARFARAAFGILASGLDGLSGREEDAVERACARIYDAVEFKLYRAIIESLVENRYPKAFSEGLPEQLEAAIREQWRCFRTGHEDSLFDFSFTCKNPLIGIGAPTYLFLPTVARALDTTCIIPEHAAVANAVGAVVADISATAMANVEPETSTGGITGYRVTGSGVVERFPLGSDDDFSEVRDEAIARALQVAEDAATQTARKRGAVGELSISTDTKSRSATLADGSDIDLGMEVSATATQRHLELARASAPVE